MDFVYFIVLVGVLIFVHESGHFLWAKLFGVRVLTFSLGFGPRIAGFSRGGTDYVLAAIPLGGYVRMLGEDPHDDIPGDDEGQSFKAQALWKRIIIVFAGPAMNLLFPLVLYFVVFLGTSQLSPPIVGDVFAGQPADGKLEPLDRVLAVDGEPIESFADLSRAVAPRPGQTLRFLVERDGEELALPITPQEKLLERPLELSERVGRIGISGSQPLSIVGVVGGGPAEEAGLMTFDWVVSVRGQRAQRWLDLRRELEQNRGSLTPFTVLRPTPLDGPLGSVLGVSTYVPRVLPVTPAPGREPGTVRAGIERSDLYVSYVTQDSPEFQAGVRTGDRLVALDGEPLYHYSELLEALEAGRGREHVLTVRRGEQTLEKRFSLAHEQGVSEHGQPFDRYVVGLRRFAPTTPFAAIANPHPLTYAVTEAFRATREVIELTALSIVRLLQGRLSVKSLGGPLTIFDAASDAARQGAVNYLFLMGFISVNLGLINLLPIPLLDGGHLLFFVLEAIAQRPVSVRAREVFSLMGLFVLFVLMVLAFKNDVERQWPSLFSHSSYSR